MITIDHKNILKETIGSSHGIGKRVLEGFCAKHQDTIDTVFKNKKAYGYDFLNLPDNRVLVTKIKTFVTEQKKNKWENIVVLGIGGSALGAIAVRKAIMSDQNNPKLWVMDNVDPEEVSEALKELNLTKTLFVVISKSGSTVEPMTLYAVFRSALAKKVPAKELKKHFVFVTDPKKGLLRPIAEKEGIATFDVPPNLGGRFSVLSSVGLVPLALAGVDINALLKGAKDMRETIKKTKLTQNPALLLAATQFLADWKKGKSMTVLMAYSNKLSKINDWYCQLLAESIGKNKRTGPTPVSAIGTTDQHSQLQLYAEGPNNKLIIFLKSLSHSPVKIPKGVLPDELSYLENKKVADVLPAAHYGTAESLAANQRPNLTLQVPAITAETVGGLFMLFEFQVAILGLLYKVNAFDQPGVENGKKITKKILTES